MSKIYVHNYQTGDWVIHKGQMKRQTNWFKYFLYGVVLAYALSLLGDVLFR